MFINFRVILSDKLEGIGNILSEQISVKFDKFSVELIIKDWKNKSYKFLASNLNKEIIPEESKINMKANSITITLKKKEKEEWGSLEKQDLTVISKYINKFNYFYVFLIDWLK